jgi:hypothetical protein
MSDTYIDDSRSPLLTLKICSSILPFMLMNYFTIVIIVSLLRAYATLHICTFSIVYLKTYMYFVPKSAICGAAMIQDFLFWTETLFV